MQNVNLINLNGGLNKIEMTYEDLGFESSIMPIVILPKGYIIKNAVFNVEKGFKTNGVDHQTSEDSYIKYRMQVGLSINTDYVLTNVDVDSTSRKSANTGDYFTTPIIYDEDVKLYLETWVVPRL